MAVTKRLNIQRAIKRPGALRAKAKRAGALTKKGTIKTSWLNKKAKMKAKTKAQKRTKAQANLAKTIRKFK